MAALNKEVKSLDEDNWKFEGPRSRINLISRPGQSFNPPVTFTFILFLQPVLGKFEPQITLAFSDLFASCVFILEQHHFSGILQVPVIPAASLWWIYGHMPLPSFQGSSKTCLKDWQITLIGGIMVAMGYVLDFHIPLSEKLMMRKMDFNAFISQLNFRQKRKIMVMREKEFVKKHQMQLL